MNCILFQLWLSRVWAGAFFMLTVLTALAEAQPGEFRGFWVNAFHSGFTNRAEVAQLMADVRAANANAVVVKVRKHGDTYYNSSYEPKAVGVSPDFDPLAELLAQGHDTNNGPRVEVHAWLVGTRSGVPRTVSRCKRIIHSGCTRTG
jgi:uncharacterized lipoprotein YddW (UPF0748 family)